MEDQVVVNNPIQQPPVNPAPVSKRQNYWIVVLIALVALVVISLIYINNLRLQKQMVPPSPEPPLPPRITSQPSPITDETANWKTYTNDSYGFSLKYPLTLKVRSPGDYLIDLVDINADSKNISLNDIKIRIGVNQSSKNFERIYAAKDNSIIAEEQHAQDAKFTKITNKVIDESYKAIDYTYEVPWDNNFTVGTIIKNDDNIIEAYSWDKDRTQLDQILATFKFTNPEDQVACTADAKLCPDGSYVSRQGPNCEFAACPQK